MQVHSFYPEISKRVLAWLSRELEEASTAPVYLALQTLNESKAQKAFLNKLPKNSVERTTFSRLDNVSVFDYSSTEKFRALLTVLLTFPVTLPMFIVAKLFHRLVVSTQEPLMTLQGVKKQRNVHKLSISCWNVGNTPLKRLSKTLTSQARRVWLLSGSFKEGPPKELVKQGFDLACSSKFCILSRYKIVEVKLTDRYLAAVLQVASKRFVTVVVADSNKAVKAKVEGCKSRDKVVWGNFKSKGALKVFSVLNKEATTYRYFIDVVALRAFIEANLFYVKRLDFEVVVRHVLQKNTRKAWIYLVKLGVDEEEAKKIIRLVKDKIFEVKNEIYRDPNKNTLVEQRSHRGGYFESLKLNPTVEVALTGDGPITEGAIVTVVLKKKESV